MTISGKIIGGYMLVLMMLVIVLSVSFHSIRTLQGAYSEFIDVEERLVDGADELRFELRDQVAHYRGLLLYPAEHKSYWDLLQKDHRQFAEAIDKMREIVLTEEGRRMLEEIVDLQVDHRQAQEKVIALVQQGKHAEAVELGVKEVRPRTDGVINRIERFRERELNLEAKGRADVAATVKKLSAAMTAVAILAIIAGLAIAFSVTRTVTRRLRESITLLSSSSAQILATAAQVASASEETATAVSETTTTVEEVRQTAEVSSRKAKHVSENAQKAAQVTQGGKRSVEESIEGMNQIREQVGSVVETVVRLSEQSQAIGEIIITVSDLADQSNILAVNAAIEAARAGEQGKGFAVVAQEVKYLADQSKEATAQIRAILGDIQKGISAVVMASEQGSKAVEAGLRQIMDAGKSIRALAESIVESSQAAAQIAASSQQQLVGMDQVALAMENIKQATMQNVAGIKQAEQAAKNLNEMARKIRLMIESKKL